MKGLDSWENNLEILPNLSFFSYDFGYLFLGFWLEFWCDFLKK